MGCESGPSSFFVIPRTSGKRLLSVLAIPPLGDPNDAHAQQGAMQSFCIAAGRCEYQPAVSTLFYPSLPGNPLNGAPLIQRIGKLASDGLPEACVHFGLAFRPPGAASTHADDPRPCSCSRKPARPRAILGSNWSPAWNSRSCAAERRDTRADGAELPPVEVALTTPESGG
jgi:hypothetical protein